MFPNILPKNFKKIYYFFSSIPFVCLLCHLQRHAKKHKSNGMVAKKVYIKTSSSSSSLPPIPSTPLTFLKKCVIILPSRACLFKVKVKPHFYKNEHFFNLFLKNVFNYITLLYHWYFCQTLETW